MTDSSVSSSGLPTVPHLPYRREVPPIRLGLAWLIGTLLFFAAFILWETHWRAFGAEPTIRNSDGLWAMQRRRIDNGEGEKTVLIGASRILFDVQLPVWERLSGERPIQLAVEGTTPLPILEDLAEDPDFTGRLLIDVSPDVFFSGFAYRGGILKYYKNETLSQRFSQRVSMILLEPFLSFYEPDFALFAILKRLPWPARPGVSNFLDVRRLSVQDADRNTRMWEKLEHDAGYRELAKTIWAQSFDVPLPGISGPEDLQRVIKEQIDKVSAAVAKLRARGIDPVFVRPPSDGPYYEVENRDFPRAPTWDVLLARTGSRGIHFENYAQLQGYWLPEWSHLSASEADRFTAALYPILRREHGWTR